MNAGETIAAYCAAWNEPDLDKRRALLADSITEDAVYIDPTVEVVGIEALMRHISRVGEMYPGSHLALRTGVDRHHDVARFGWRRVLADATTRPESVDFVEFATDGRLSRILGFFGPLLDTW